MAHGKTLELRYITRKPPRVVARGRVPYRNPDRVERKRRQHAERVAARARAVANGLGRRG